jgi:hypothetical protein
MDLMSRTRHDVAMVFGVREPVVHRLGHTRALMVPAVLSCLRAGWWSAHHPDPCWRKSG